MISKFFNICVVILCSSGILLGGCATSQEREANNTVDFMYRSAANGDTQAMLNAIARGNSVNEVNTDGKTALCVAVEEQDYAAYGYLLAMGAKKDPACLNDIDNDDLKEFIANQPRDVIYTQSGTQMIRYVPDHNPPQKQYPTPMNNSVITGTVLVVVGVIAGVLIYVWLS